mgnify:CR=1 FL=1
MSLSGYYRYAANTTSSFHTLYTYQCPIFEGCDGTLYNYSDTLTCPVGYSGLLCSRCSYGFYLDAISQECLPVGDAIVVSTSFYMIFGLCLIIFLLCVLMDSTQRAVLPSRWGGNMRLEWKEMMFFILKCVMLNVQV